MSSYTDKFKDPRWQKKRLEILERDGFCCQLCFDGESMLHVHHCFYSNKYKNPWQYPDESLITLCDDCHQKEHKFWNEANKVLTDTLRCRGITAGHLMELAVAFEKSKYDKFKWDVAITALCNTIKNKTKMNKVVKDYLNSLGKKKK